MRFCGFLKGSERYYEGHSKGLVFFYRVFEPQHDLWRTNPRYVKPKPAAAHEEPGQPESLSSTRRSCMKLQNACT